MIISLYTSRVVLYVLGVEDYSIYQVAGGVVGMLTFLNSALSNGSSRFITFEMGKGNVSSLNKVFQTSFVAHVLMAFLIIIIAETIGLWFFYNKLIIPNERLFAASIVFHLSILTSIISIIQVPYMSLIIAHEKMDIYAYLSIIEVTIKLLIVYLIQISSFDKLIFYASLLALFQIIMNILYMIYCIKNFLESSLKSLKIDWKLMRNILSFSSWSLLGNGVHALNGQGLTIITNMFFTPSVVAARALSIQINSAASQLLQNVRTAANPQIIKLYSSGAINESRRLLILSTKYSFYLMLLFIAPLVLTTDQLLSIWLVEVPQYTTIFVQLIFIQTLFFTFDTCFYTALYACGRVRENALISPAIYALQFLTTYILFKCGFSPISLSIMGVLASFIAAVIVKPVLLKKFAGYEIVDLYKLLCKCVVVATVIFILLYSLDLYIHLDNVLELFLKLFLYTTISAIFILLFGFSKSEKNKIMTLIKNKFKIKK